MDGDDVFLTLAHAFLLEQHVVLSTGNLVGDLLYFKYLMRHKINVRRPYRLTIVISLSMEYLNIMIPI